MPPPALPAARPGSHADPVWQVRLLGRFEAQRGGQCITNFGGRSVAALLARLALQPQRSHAREELVELLWPGVALDVGRNRLRQALFTLRQLLEPPGPAPAPVLVADRLSVRVVPGAIACDVAAFEASLKAGRVDEAAALYVGELLPGFYDDWIVDERLRLAAFEDRLGTPHGAAPAAPARASAAEPAAVPPGLLRTGLPVYLTRFFGRDAEAAQLQATVCAHRFVTLLGPGGGGKTRLAVELAAGLRDGAAPPACRFDLVAFVPLADCGSAAQMADALCAALQLHVDGDDALQPLVDALVGRRALLVLDNFEQLCGVADEVVAGLLERLPALHLLVTSRRALGLDGEREQTIQTLELPARDTPLREAVQSPALALFIDRARAVRADFHASQANLEALVELAHLLEGMPLAIELAAARVRSIAPAAMAAMLRSARDATRGQSLGLLHRHGPRGALDTRHASMQRVIEWSWRLLGTVQARLLAALTVFHGGFTAEAAQSVCGDLADPVALGLDELVAHSLLRTERLLDDDGAAPRFVSLEPVREFAAHRLDADEARRRRALHRAWLRGWATRRPATPSLAEMRAELPNLLAALASALADEVPGEAVALCLPLRRVLDDVELPAEGLEMLVRAVQRCTDPALRSQGHALVGPLLFNAGQRELALAQVCAGLEGAPPGVPWRGRALYALARVQWRVRRQGADVLPWIAEAEALAVEHGDIDLQASLLALQGFIALAAREPGRGEALHRQALELWQRQGNQHAMNSGRYNLASSAWQARRYGEVLQRLDELDESTRSLHDWRRLGQSLNVRGNALSELHRWAEAVQAFRACIRITWDTMALHELAYGLWNLPRALAHEGEAERAVTLAAFAVLFWETRFGVLSASDRHDLRRLRRLAHCRIDARRLDAAWERGRQLPLAEAVALALAQRD